MASIYLQQGKLIQAEDLLKNANLILGERPLFLQGLVSWTPSLVVELFAGRGSLLSESIG